MTNPELARKIIALKDHDLAVRSQLIQDGELFNGYHPKMRAVHERNATALAGIIKENGFPTPTLVGKEGFEAACLIIQHAISLPDFMRSCRDAMAEQPGLHLPEQIRLAYLSDRIAVFEGKPQEYGTQFDWDKNGQMSPQPCDDLDDVERRRARLGLSSLAEQTVIMRERTVDEGEGPPADYEKRKRAMLVWRKEVGWMD